MFTSLVGPVEVFFYWPEAVFGNFYWPGAIGSPLASSPVQQVIYVLFLQSCWGVSFSFDMKQNIVIILKL